jgi:hypothetical protein
MNVHGVDRGVSLVASGHTSRELRRLFGAWLNLDCSSPGARSLRLAIFLKVEHHCPATEEARSSTPSLKCSYSQSISAIAAAMAP